MTKPYLLKHIAQTAYNVGYAAKKHFATYDLAAKAPGSISFLTFSVGLFFLLIDFTAKKYFSAACIILGILGLRISMWEGKKETYLDVGRQLTGIFNKLKALYYQVKAAEQIDLSAFEAQLAALEDEFNEVGLGNQMLFSDWYAHYKFFWQHQIDWIDEQLHFQFFRDMIPLSFTASVVLLLFIGFVAFVIKFA
jgi:sensor histidine kinase YesM